MPGLCREGSSYAGKGLVMQERVWLCREGSGYAGKSLVMQGRV